MKIKIICLSKIKISSVNEFLLDLHTTRPTTDKIVGYGALPCVYDSFYITLNGCVSTNAS